MITKENLFKRQLSLKEVGKEGQEKLLNAKILVIGAGGLGSPLLQYISAAGVGHITIIDPDFVCETNLHRQNIYTLEQVGQSKALCAKHFLEQRNPFIKIQALQEYFDDSFDIKDYDIVIDCSDNFKTKFLAHDLCYQFKIPFSVASIHKFEGQLQFFTFKEDEEPCLRCLWPQMPSQTCISTCEEEGILGATAGIIGSIQAMTCLKFILGLTHIKNNENLIIDLMNMDSYTLKVSKNPLCPNCYPKNNKTQNIDQDLELYLTDIKAEDFFKINLTDKETKFQDFKITPDSLYDELEKIKPSKPLLLFCHKGFTSLKATKELRRKGFKECYSLTRGYHFES